jgi:hypothetical protein
MAATLVTTAAMVSRAWLICGEILLQLHMVGGNVWVSWTVSHLWITLCRTSWPTLTTAA